MLQWWWCCISSRGCHIWPSQVVGIPKTIDNDIPMLDCTFGHSLRQWSFQSPDVSSFNKIDIFHWIFPISPSFWSHRNFWVKWIFSAQQISGFISNWGFDTACMEAERAIKVPQGVDLGWVHVWHGLGTSDIWHFLVWKMMVLMFSSWLSVFFFFVVFLTGCLSTRKHC